jgi:uncharacterized protein YgiM (DUF1202 family)
MKRLFLLAAAFAGILFLATGCNQQVSTQQADRLLKPAEIRKYVAVTALNLRECPGSECRIIRVLEQGDSGLLLAEDSGWVKMLIDHSDAQGWVAAKYLSAQPVARQQKKQSRPPLPEEEFAQPHKNAPPKLKEELAVPEVDNGPEKKATISEEFAD